MAGPGVAMDATGATLTNRAQIFGGTGGAGADASFPLAGVPGIEGGAAVVVTTNATLINQNQLYGGSGGNGGNGGSAPAPACASNGLSCPEFSDLGVGSAGGKGGKGGPGAMLSAGSGSNADLIEGGSGGLGGVAGPRTGSASAGGDGGDGIELSGTATFANLPTTGPSPEGTISGHAGQPGTDGVGLLFAGGNGGSGAVIDAATLTSTGTSTNHGSLLGGDGGKGGNGVADTSNGQSISAHPGDGGNGGMGVELTNSGTLVDNGLNDVVGGDGGDGGTGVDNFNGGSGGAGGAAVSVSGKAVLTTSSASTYVGGNGGNGQPGQVGLGCGNGSRPYAQNYLFGATAGNGGNGGAGIVVSGATVTHQGVASGGSPGSNGAVSLLSGCTSPVPGAGIVENAAATVVLGGAALGGLVAGGGDRAPAIALHNGGNTLELEAGWTLTGGSSGAAVSDSGSTNGGDALAFGGSAGGSFDMALMLPSGASATASTQFVGFSSVHVASAWTLTGTSQYAGETVVLPGGTADLEGTLTHSTIDVNAVLEPPYATLQGLGSAGAVFNAGMFKPGRTGTSQLGVFSTQNFTQLSSGTTLFNVYNSAHASAQLQVSGTATLDGTLDVEFSTQPTIGQQFVLIQSGGISGHFSAVIVNGLASGEVALLDYSATAVTLEIVAPSSAATHFAVSAPGTAQIQLVEFTNGLPANGTPVTITALDQNGVVSTGYSGTVVLTTTDANASVFTNTYTTPPATMTLVNGKGTATFWFGTAGNQFVTATDSSDGTITGTSNAIDVQGPTTIYLPTEGSFSIAAPSTATSGVPIQVTVTAYNNIQIIGAPPIVDTGFNGVVQVSSSDPAAVLPAAVTFTNGVATFPVTLNTAGNQTVSVADALASNITATSAPILVSNVVVDTVTHLQVSAPSTDNVGTPIAFTVSALDAGNAVLGSYTGTVQFSSSDGAAVLPASATLVNGVGSFTATMNTVGNQTITAADIASSSIAGSSADIAVQASQLLTLGAAPSVAVAGTGTLTVTATTPNSGNAVTLTSSPSTVCSVHAPTTTGNGVFTAVVDGITPGACTVTASLAAGNHYTAAAPVMQTIQVGALATTLGVGATPQPVTQGQTVNLTATVSVAATAGASAATSGISTISSRTASTRTHAIGGSAAPAVTTATISFFIDGNDVGDVPLGADDTASLPISTLTAGTHALTASFSGNGLLAASTTPQPLSIVVNAAAVPPPATQAVVPAPLLSPWMLALMISLLALVGLFERLEKR